MRTKSDGTTLEWTDVGRAFTQRVGNAASHSTFLSPVSTTASGLRRRKSKHESPQELRARLQAEIAHGKEYLSQVQRELQESVDLLEQWSVYESACSLQPLDHLVETVTLRKEVVRFLAGWLERRTRQLALISKRTKGRRRTRR